MTPSITFEGLTSAGTPLAANVVDERVWRFLVEHRSAVATRFFEFMSLFANPISVIIIVTAVAVALLIRHERRLALRLVMTTSITWLTTTIVKLSVERERPPVADRLITVGEYSFPSGHASQSIALYGSLAIIALVVGGGRFRGGIIAAAIFMAVAIGVSRLYLGVHWLSDVIAGWLLGALWVGAIWSTRRRPRIEAVGRVAEPSV